MTSGPLLIPVRALPRASRSEIEGIRDGRLCVRTTAPPADGRANRDIARQLAKACGIPPSAVELTRGARNRDKTFRIGKPRKQPAWLAELAPKA